MSDQEIKKDVGKNRLDLIPVECIDAIGKVLTFGAEKYFDSSWRQGINYSRVYAATQRHLQAFWGEAPDIDEESKLSHLSHAFCNLAFLLAYEENKERYQTFDDRAGSNNEFYKQQEGLVKSITKLVQENPGFFECQTGDDMLQKVYDTLDYAINTSQQFPDQPDFPDLTKMTHPEACKHLEVGMRVKVLCRGPGHTRGWRNSWNMEYMDECIGNVFTIETVNAHGVNFMETGWCSFPAFVLEIVSRSEETK